MRLPRDLLASTYGRFISFGLLYVAEGLPYGFSSTALVAFMRQQGLSIEQIGAFVAAIFLPWSFKWVWAPMIDVVRLERYGGRRTWILGSIGMTIVTLLLMALADFEQNYELLVVIVILNNFFCATNDVAIDSLAVGILPESERGRGNGFMFGGQSLGIALGGGGAIFVFGLFGFNVALGYVAGALALCWLFAYLFIHDDAASRGSAPRTRARFRDVVSRLTGFVRSVYSSFLRSGPGPRLGLVFSIMPIGAMGLAYALLGTLKVDYGLDTNQIAQISVFNVTAGAIGCLLGGVLGDRFGLKHSLAAGYALTALLTAYMAWLIEHDGLEGIPLNIFYTVIVAHGLVFGIGFGLRAAIFMGMTNPVVAATQFTTFMAMGNLATSIANFWQGRVAERLDYSIALYIDALLVLVPLALVPFLKPRESDVPIIESAEAPAID